MTTRSCLLLLVILVFAGCDKWPAGESRSSPQSAPGWSIREVSRSEAKDSQRYQIHTAPDGRTFRLDTQTGQLSVVTDKGVKVLPDDRNNQLRVGEIYTLENGKSAVYEGNEKLNSDTRRIADTLVKKHSDGMPTMSEVDAELARRKRSP